MKIEELWALVEKYEPENMGANDHIQKHDGRGNAISFWPEHRWPVLIEFKVGKAVYFGTDWLFHKGVEWSISGPRDTRSELIVWQRTPKGVAECKKFPKDTPLEEIFGEDIVALFQLLR